MRLFAVFAIAGMLGALALAILHYLVFRPWRSAPERAPKDVRRYGVWERLVHLAAGAGFLILVVTAFYPVLSNESIEGWMLMVHVGASPLFFLGVVASVLTWAEDCRFTKEDGTWLAQRLRYPFQSSSAGLPAGRFDVLQKGFFWFSAFLCLVLLVSMLLSMVQLFGPDEQVWLARLHRWTALVLVVAVILHSYRTLLAKPGGLSALFSGKVSAAWLKRYHPLGGKDAK